MKRGEDFRVHLPAGEHKVVAQIGARCSNTLLVVIGEGETALIEVGANTDVLWFLGLRRFDRDGFLYLRLLRTTRAWT